MRRSIFQFCGFVLAGVLTACDSGNSSDPPENNDPAGNPTLPSASIASASTNEGNSGVTLLSFTVTLSAAAADAVTVNYASSDVSATAGSDYVAVSGTLTIPAGAISAMFDVTVNGDTGVESDETFTVALSNPSANVILGIASAVGGIINDDTAFAPPGVGLNDTGVTRCANATGNDATCNDATAGTDQYPGQDAEHGRDMTANADIDGHAGFSFIKLDANGTPLPDQSVAYGVTPWACIKDQVTGLIWEVKTDDGSLRDKDWRYSWYNATGVNAGRGTSAANGGACVDANNCDTEKYAAAVNAANLCGQTDWRLPTRAELMSLVDYGAPAPPLVDSGFLPNTVAERFWSATPDHVYSVWTVDFNAGGTRAEGKLTVHPVRLVRGGYGP